MVYDQKLLQEKTTPNCRGVMIYVLIINRNFRKLRIIILNCNEITSQDKLLQKNALDNYNRQQLPQKLRWLAI